MVRKLNLQTYTHPGYTQRTYRHPSYTQRTYAHQAYTQQTYIFHKILPREKGLLLEGFQASKHGKKVEFTNIYTKHIYFTKFCPDKKDFSRYLQIALQLPPPHL